MSSMMTATGTAVDAKAGQLGLHAHDGTNAFTFSWQIEDAADPTDTSSLVDSEWLNVSAHDGTQAFDINPASSPFNTDGWTVASADIGAADGTTRKWLALSVGGDEVINRVVNGAIVQSKQTADANRVMNGFIFQEAAAAGATPPPVGGPDAGEYSNRMVRGMFRGITRGIA